MSCAQIKQAFINHIKSSEDIIDVLLRKSNAEKYKNLKAPIERLAVALGSTLDMNL